MANGNRNLAVRLLLGVKDNLTGPLKGIQGKVLAIFAAITAYINVRLFAGALESAAEFEEQLDRVQAVARATDEQMRVLKASAEELGASTRFTATQVAQAEENLLRAGLTIQETVAALPPTLALAQGASIELADAASLVTVSAKSMNIELTDSGRIADVLSLAASLANTNVLGVGEALSYVGPTANAANFTLEETVGLIGKLADAGIDAGRAGTSLNNILGQFQDPASKFRQELSSIGIVTDDFRDALAQLEAAGPRGQAAILALGTEAGPALKALLSQGSDALDELIDRLDKADGSSQKAADQMDSNLRGAMAGLGSAWDAVRRYLVEPLLEPIASQARELADTLRRLAGDGSLDAFRDALLEAFNQGVAAVKRFVAEFRPEEWLQSLANFTAKSVGYLGRFGSLVSGIANTIKTTFLALYQSVTLVAGLFTKAIAYYLSAEKHVTGMLARIGLATDEQAQKAESLAEAWHQAADGMIDASNAAFEEMKKSGYAAGQAFIDAVAPADDAADAIDKVGKAALNYADAARAASEMQDGLTGKVAAGAIELERYETAAEHAARAEREAEAAKQSLINAARQQANEAERNLKAMQAETRLASDLANAVGTELRARIDAAEARGDEITARQLTIKLYDHEAKAAAAHAARLAAEAKAARELADALKAQADAGAELSVEQQEDQAAAERNAQAKEAEAKAALAVADAKKEEASANRLSTGATEDNTRASKEAIEAQRAAFDKFLSQYSVTADKMAAEQEKIAERASQAWESSGEGIANHLTRVQQNLRTLSDEAAEAFGDRFVNAYTYGFQSFVNAVNRATAGVRQDFFAQAEAVDEMVAALERGDAQAIDLAANTEYVKDAFSLVGEQRLEGLRSALQDAINKTQQLRQEAEAAAEAARDRLDRARGDDEAIRQREYEREVARLEEILAQAEARRDNEAAEAARRALEDTKAAYEIEKRRAAEREKDRKRERDSGPGDPAGPAPGGPRRRRRSDDEEWEEPRRDDGSVGVSGGSINGSPIPLGADTRLLEVLSRLDRSLSRQQEIVLTANGERLARAILPEIDKIKKRTL